jgi:hypothetical protein
VREFSEFCIKYDTDAQFRRWFEELDQFLRNAGPDPFRWDRLIAAEANLSALAVELDSKGRIMGETRIANLERVHHTEVATLLEHELEHLIRPREDWHRPSQQ